MKIIKRGKDPRDTPWSGTCHVCHSILECLEPELKVEWDQRESGSFGRCGCPVCGNSVVFYPIKPVTQEIRWEENS